MKKIILLLLITGILAGCKGKKASLKDGEEVAAEDFIEFFPERKLPFTIADTSLLRKTSDSAIIGNNVFNQFIPDSILQKDFGKTAKPKIYALGRAHEKNKETYLFFKAVSGNKRAGYLACFNKEDVFVGAMTIVRSGFDATKNSYGLLDSKFQITTYRERAKNDGTAGFKRNVYIFNNAANVFTLIMTEPNEDIIQTIINPIDTLARKHKYSGDYVKDSRNFISVRDGRNISELQFFVHFEKDNGECTGELKGNAKFSTSTIALYQEGGSPCVVQFNFTSGSITMKEIGGCGQYRDIKCFFEGYYPKRKKPEAKKTTKKT